MGAMIEAAMLSRPHVGPRRTDAPISFVEAVDRNRRLECLRYDACLNLAAVGAWGGWSCCGCLLHLK